MCGAPGRPVVPSLGLRVYYARMLRPLATTGAALGGWAYGTYEPNSVLFGRAVGRGRTRERVAYLTFDDGPNPDATEPILDTLATSDVPAAFFLVGEHVRRFPAIARRVAAAGHEVGNHTLRHQKLHLRGPRRIREELERAHELIVDATSRVPRSFRAPHGDRNPFVGVGLALKFLTGFPWHVTFAALLDADRWLLVIALAVNLSSLVAKGWGWHLILKPVAPHSWRVAQEANLVGAAVNDLSVAVAGEAARVHLIVHRSGVPAGAAVSSVVWTRVAEGLALALFLVMAPSVLQLEPWLRGVQSAVGLALVVVLLLAWGRGWASLADRLPASLRSRVAVLRTMGAGGRLLWPTAFALYNWAAQWATYHLVLRATHVPVSLAASFTALIVVNLGGLLRPTPANIGVTEAALVVGLLPFGVGSGTAVAAGLALQGLQVLPVLFLGAMVTGWRLLKLESELA